MGTWGLGTFDDDFAVDWLEDLSDSDPIAFFKHCLDLTGHIPPGHLACVGVVCSAEMIHSVLACRFNTDADAFATTTSIDTAGNPLPEAARDWLRQGSWDRAENAAALGRLVPDAVAGLHCVLADESEMRQLWEDDSESFQRWVAKITRLADRLSELPPGCELE